MASIQYRERNGAGRWVVQIRIKRKGRVVYSQSRSFIKEPVARAWADKREAELRVPGALERAQSADVTVCQVLKWYEADYDGATKFGRSNLSHLKFMMGYEPLASRSAVDLIAVDLVGHVRQRRSEGTGPATVNNDLIWLRGAYWPWGGFKRDAH